MRWNSRLEKGFGQQICALPSLLCGVIIAIRGAFLSVLTGGKPTDFAEQFCLQSCCSLDWLGFQRLRISVELQQLNHWWGSREHHLFTQKGILARETASGYVNLFLILQAWKLSQMWSSCAGLDWAVCLGTFGTYPAWENLCSAVASHPRQQPRLLGSNLSLPKQAMETRGWPEGLCNKFSLPYQHVANNPIVSVHQYAPGWREAEMRFAFWCKCPAQALQRVAVSCSCSILIRSTGIPQGFGFFLLGLFFFPTPICFKPSAFKKDGSRNTSCRVLVKHTWAEYFSLQCHNFLWQRWVWGGGWSVTPMVARKSWRKIWTLWLYKLSQLSWNPYNAKVFRIWIWSSVLID